MTQPSNSGFDVVEQQVLKIAAALMVTFAIALLGAIWALDLNLATCLRTPPKITRGEVIRRGDQEYEVRAIARMWNFEPQEIRLPVGARATFYLASADVMHGFHINGTRVNLMAAPGAINQAFVRFDQPGVYRVVCHEYCGSGHQNMLAHVIVGDATEFSAVNDAGATPHLVAGAMGSAAGPQQDPEVARLGSAAMAQYACVGCHSVDARPGIGPSFRGLYGKMQRYSDGSLRKIDEAAIREAILQPQKRIVAGYENAQMPLMPVPERELDHLVQYIKTLPGE